MVLFLRRAGFLAGMGVLLSFVAGCVIYLKASYATLHHWYLSLNNCFYRVATWDEVFFTPQTKSAGNYWAVGGIAVSVCFLAYLFTGRKAFWGTSKRVREWWPEVPALVLFLVGGCVLWMWGNRQLAPASDEVFSYVHVARLPLFQSWSYYMLPNNHIAFNLLNSGLHGFFSYGLLSGRLISLGAYLGTLTTAFYWLRCLGLSKTTRYAILGALAVQSMTLLFSFQARGYALYTFAAWVAFALTHQLLAGRVQRYFWAFAPAVVLGYAVLPSFLYVHGALLLWVAAAQLGGRKDLGAFWRAHLFIAGATFLFYLPLLGFSGLPALAQNKWVHSAAPDFATFLGGVVPTAQYYLLHDFAGATQSLAGQGVLLLTVLLPLFLYPFLRGKERLLTGAFLCLWAAFWGTAIFMRQLPPGRSLTPVFSLSLGLSLCTFALAARRFWAGRKTVAFAVAALPSLFFGAKCPLLYPAQLQTAAYGPSVAAINQQAQGLLQRLPPAAHVGFGDEAFHFQFLWQQKARKAVPCPAGKEAWLLLGNEETLPPTISHYQKNSSALDVDCYQRKGGPIFQNAK